MMSDFLQGPRARWATAISSLAVLILLASTPAAAEDYDFIPVVKRPTRLQVAAPAFNALSALPANDAAIKELTQLLREAIAMTGLFELVDPKAYPPLAPVGQREDVAAWMVINTNLLIRSDVGMVEGGRYQVEFRCFDVKLDKMVLGKRYSGEKDLFGRMIFRYVDELMEYLTGKRSALEARIVFVSDATGRNEIRVMDVDGSHGQAITSNRTLNLCPAWSPDGSMIIFTGYRARNPDLYVANLQKNSIAKFYGQRGLNMGPEFSPDGKTVAFSREGADGNIDIYLISLGGGDLRRITTAGSNELSPAWSPDGSQLAFVSDRRGGTPQVYVLNLAAGHEGPSNPAVRLSTQGTYNTSPAWSPDGRYVAFAGRRGGQFDLFLVDMASEDRKMRRLTSTVANEENPAWSPDSRFLVYDSDRVGNYDIYLMSIYGGTPKRITRGKAKERMPAWSSRMTQ